MAPKQKAAGRGKQDYGTPRAFLDAIERQYGPIGLDLACTKANMVAPCGIAIDAELDSLAQSWVAPMVWNKAGNVVEGLSEAIEVAFLNPPFAQIAPWASKVAECRWLRRWTLMLVPASMGSRWWADHVLGQTMVFGIPRMAFVDDGEASDIYPKDLALVAAGYGVAGVSYWDWRKAP